MTISYIAPQTVRHWHPIGISKSINKNKPYQINLGTLSLLLWFNNTNNPNIIINTCKYLGNNLKDSEIRDNQLISPIYNKIYDHNDNFGSIIENNGLYWWSYKSYEKKINKEISNVYNNEIEINIDLITFILNFISLFDNDINNKYHKYYYNNKQVIIINDKYKILFKYPYTIIIKSKLYNKKIMISILPINYLKLKIFITTYDPISNLIAMIYKYYIKDLFENKITIENIYIKNFFILKREINNKNRYLEIIYKLFKDYMFLNEHTINHFMINKNYY